MAGAGYKLFATGDVLTAAQVNTYLMEQTVMRFADSAARTTALSGVLAEGMVSYLQDTNTLEVYDGAAWVGATGDITGLTAGTGISISSATGPVPTVTNSMATEITAKGDLIVGTGSGTFDNLPVAENGSTIVADSSASTGLRYQGNFAAGKNAVINGDFNIWQRGTTFTNPSAGTFTCDRYSWDSVSMTGSITRQAFTAGTAPVAGYEGTYFARLDITSGTQYGELVQKIENGRTNAGQTVTASFWAKLNSGASGWQVNVVQNFGTGGSPSSAVLAGQTSFTPTASWQRFTFTVAVPSVAGKTFGTNNNSYLAMTIQKTSTTASQLDTWGWQLEVGNTATAFQTATGTLQGELAACQRYYYRANFDGSAAYPYFGQGGGYSSTVARLVMPFPVAMRRQPTALDTSVMSTFRIQSFDENPSIQPTGIAFNSNFTFNQTGVIDVTVASGLTAEVLYLLRGENTTTASIGWSAEL